MTDVLDIPVEAIRVAEWHPTPDASGPPTQVHLLIEGGDVPLMAIRFKGPDTLAKVAAALVVHGQNVFGDSFK